ncbi:MAG: transcription antitermination factor NusB [Ignavibacteriales bacterium]
MRRRQARELALKVLFQVDVAGADPDEAMSFLLWEEKATEGALRFATEIVRGTMEHREEIDARLAAVSREWTLERMANIDRNVLRLGCFELMFRDDIPASVAISEAIELAKKYGDAESGKFVNGILGKIVQDLDTRQ